MALLRVISVNRRSRFLLTVAAFFLFFVYMFYDSSAGLLPGGGGLQLQKVLPPAHASNEPVFYVNSTFDWSRRVRKYPIPDADLVGLPAGAPQRLRRIQHDFKSDPAYKANDNKLLREARRESIRDAFRRGWESYRQHAWGYDELLPIKLKGVDGYSGWGATLVDGLDALWVLGLRDEFDEAARAIATIDWDAAASFECSLFETNIRYLGGLLAAYEMSGAVPLLDKAKELAHMLLAAFDTANHMPANRLHFERARQGLLVPGDHEAAAAAGTLSLEFTKLAQLTGDVRFYDAVDRVKRELARVQDTTTLPGLWPTFLDLQNDFKADTKLFSLGALADSLYEYLPKMYILLGGLDDAYRSMYAKAADAARKHLLFRPMVPDPERAENDVLFAGNVLATGSSESLLPEGQHLTCFAGGMFALAGRLFDRPEDVGVGRRLAQGCVWAYNQFPTGVMPEVFDLVPCPGREERSWLLGGTSVTAGENETACAWDEKRWRELQVPRDPRAPRGFASVRDPRYLLRPEAVESVFVLYRITGDRKWQEAAWNMFLSIERSTATRAANSAIADVTVSGPPQKLDQMESFWFAETLKYLYLTFTEPDYFSLDDWVFNTEAHPFKIPKPPREEAASATTGAAAAAKATVAG